MVFAQIAFAKVKHKVKRIFGKLLKLGAGYSGVAGAITTFLGYKAGQRE